MTLTPLMTFFVIMTFITCALLIIERQKKYGTKDVPGGTRITTIKANVAYKCMFCCRIFSNPCQDHNCNGNYRKHRHRWEILIVDNILPKSAPINRALKTLKELQILIDRL